MLSDTFIGLRLRTAPPPPGGDEALSSALRPFIDRLLALFGQLVAAVDDEKTREEAAARLADFRSSFATVTEPSRIEALAEACLSLCTTAVEEMHGLQTERKSELRRLVTLVRETMKMLVGDGDAFASEVSSSAEGFNALLDINDIHRLKAGLANEVLRLQTMALDRQKQWQKTVSVFESRVDALQHQLLAVREEATHDPLTQVANRRGFDEAFERYLKMPGRQFVLALFDLDNFKQINDTLGHGAGDAVLTLVAKTLKGSFRDHDVVARLGGDEFALLAGTTMPMAESRLRGMLSALASRTVDAEGPAPITLSCGVVEYSAGDTLETMTQRADEALYDAKRRGKNRLITKSTPFIRDLRR